MVLGHSKCGDICTSCRKDCVCSNCRSCHTCNCSRNYSYYNPSRYIHSCSTYESEQKEFESEKKAKRAEIRDLETKIRELKLNNENLESQNRELNLENNRLESERLKVSADRLSLQKFTRVFGSKTVTFRVGPERKGFTVYVDVIREASIYFLENLPVEIFATKGETIFLEEEVHNADAFGVFLEYCHLGTYFGTYFETGAESPGLLLLHARVYALAERFQCSQLKALALRKATDWCYGNSIQRLAPGDTFRDIFPDILDAVRIVYRYTVDSESGVLPSAAKSESNGGEAITRDRFRLLLAHLAAAYLTNLQAADGFPEIHNDFPDFNTDMLLFIKDGPVPPPNLSSASSELTVVGAETEEGAKAFQTENVLAFSRFFNSEIYTVLVGETNERFNVHATAMECSDYFRSLMASDMVEAHDKTVYLNSEVDSADAFEKFVQYCYFDDYTCGTDRADNFTRHAGVYLLADRLSCQGLKDLALRKTNAICGAAYSNEPDEILIAMSTVVAMVYENTYDIYSGKPPKATSDSKADAAGEPSSAVVTVKKFRKGNGKRRYRTTTVVDKGNVSDKEGERSRDGFRVLLARFASVYLSRLREQAAFVAAHHAFPDFATDVMLLATAGEKMELDQDGQLKLH
ncbi:hypothetical protein TWF281_003777 [Arthrobotrys megalospora]